MVRRQNHFALADGDTIFLFEELRNPGNISVTRGTFDEEGGNLVIF